jgi:putative phosphotransacetylase
MEINVGISNRHVHLTEEVFKKLFGDVEIDQAKELTQPGQYASNFKVTIKTEKGVIENVRVLGPYRNYNQVEISKTDAFKLGLNPPVRNSGALENSESVILIGTNGEVYVPNCCIIPARHIHITPEDVIKYGLEGKKTVMVRINTEKGGIMDNVYIKAAPNSYFELHVDTDDGNAFLLKQGDKVEILNEN